MAEMRQGRKEAAVMAARIFVAVASGSRSCITLNCYRRKGRKSIYHRIIMFCLPIPTLISL